MTRFHAEPATADLRRGNEGGGFAVRCCSFFAWPPTRAAKTGTAFVDPTAPGKVIRGGAYDVPRERATATYRGVVQPGRTYDKTGFRCVKPAR